MLGLIILLSIALLILTGVLTAMLAWEMVHPPRHTTAWALARKLPADPGELGLPFEEWWLERPDGTRLAVWDVKVNSNPGIHSQGTSAPLTAVFVHGWGHSRIDSLQRIAPFLPFVDRVVLYDLRGHGDSTGTSRLGDREEDDLIALLDRLGDARVVLIGHSMGAVIAISAASKLNIEPRVFGLIAYGPYCEFHPSLQGRLRVNGLPTRPLTDLALLIHRMRGVTPLAIVPSQLSQLQYPLLIVHGSDDGVSPIQHARRIASGMRGATLLEIEHAAHADAHIAHNGRHDVAVQQFLRNVSGERLQA